MENNSFLNESEVSLINIMQKDTAIATENMLSLSDEKQAKEALANIRKTIGLQLDGRKMRQANILMDGIETAIEKANSKETHEGIKIETAMDYKFYTEAIEKNLKILQTLLRLDSVDGQGTAGRINVGVKWEAGDGSSTSVIIQQEV